MSSVRTEAARIHDVSIDLKVHLARYKTDVLGIVGNGTFRWRGEDIPYDHILPHEQGWSNVLDAARVLAQRYLPSHPEVLLHRDFHHLNSSQAFAFNLFFPFFEPRGPTSGVLLRALGESGVVEDWKPESVPDRAEGTNVDVGGPPHRASRPSVK